MAQQIKKKYIGPDQIDGSKIKLNEGEALRGVDSSSAVVDLIKLGASDEVLIKGQEAAIKSQVDAADAALAGDISTLQGEVSQHNVDIANAVSDAAAAQSTADNAITAASAAQTTADNAELVAAAAQTDATQALADAADALAAATAAAADSIPLTEKGAVNGVASLDGSGKVPISQLPSAIMEYQGTWNATTNIPALADFVDGAAAGSAIGNVYRVSVAGSQDLGSGSIAFSVGDYAILNSDGKWEKSDTTDAVSTVNGASGDVVLDADDIAISAISGIVATDVQGALAELAADVAASGSGDFKANGTVPMTAALNMNQNQLSNVSSVIPWADGGGNLGTNSRTFNNVYLSSGIKKASGATVIDIGNNQLIDDLGGASVSYSARILHGSGVNGQMMNWNGANVSFNSKRVVDVADPTAAQDAATKAYVDAAIPTWSKYKRTLDATDITNQYIDLPHEVVANSVTAFVDRLAIHEGAAEDYTLSLEGGVTRLTFLNDIATGGASELIAGDSIYVKYVR